MFMRSDKSIFLGCLGLTFVLVSAPFASVQAGGDGGDEVGGDNLEGAGEPVSPRPSGPDPAVVIAQARAAYPLAQSPVKAGSRTDATNFVDGLENATFCGVDAPPPVLNAPRHNPKLLPASVAVLEGVLVDAYILERIIEKIGQSGDRLAPHLLIYMFENSEAVIAPSILAKYGEEALDMSSDELVKVVDEEVERGAASLRRKAIRASGGTSAEEYLISEGLDDSSVAVRVAAAQRAAGFGEVFRTELSVLCASEQVFCKYYDDAAYR